MSPWPPVVGLWVHGAAVGLLTGAAIEGWSLTPTLGFIGFNVGAFAFSLVVLTKAEAP